MKIKIWYCDVLFKDFDFNNAILKFPLEKTLPTKFVKKDVENEVVGGIHDVTYTSAGNSYSLVYGYTYSPEFPAQKYGFFLNINEDQAALSQPLFNTNTKIIKWLEQFGNVRYLSSMQPPLVGYGEVYPHSPLPLFSFTGLGGGASIQ